VDPKRGDNDSCSLRHLETSIIKKQDKMAWPASLFSGNERVVAVSFFFCSLYRVKNAVMWWARRLGSGRHVVLRTRGPHDSTTLSDVRDRVRVRPPDRLGASQNWAVRAFGLWNGREELTLACTAFHAILVLSQLYLHVKSKRFPRDNRRTGMHFVDTARIRVSKPKQVTRH
jgi:hypothetical protein